ncbi:MAG: M23 family metallopeptidase [Rickettsiales bacterium]|nr:M23 family metallopeptidase [Rickettsiales bacterium]
MNKSYLLKKKMSAALLSIGMIVLHVLVSIYKFIFTKRTILFVTNQKIRSISFGPFSQLAIIIIFFWVFNLFDKSLRYNEIIEAKSEEIKQLRSANSFFQDEFEQVNDKLKKINDYLISITGSSHKVKGEEMPDFKTPNNIKEDDLSRNDKKTIEEIKEASLKLANIHSFARDRIVKIENAIRITGLNLKKNPEIISKSKNEKEISLNDQKSLTSRQGGPLVEIDEKIKKISVNADDQISKHLKKSELANDLDRLTMLENLVKVMPLSKPMKNYFVSSGFGTRIDPITGNYALHQGLDFVGPYHEKVISPSSGIVILAGQFSDYGNAVVIDHGFGITTRYGHLAAVKVKEGQTVKQGQVIAIQGNTGRSTGSHLHYEVRYRNTPLNPKKFLEAGDSLFNDEKTVKYVNS